MHKNDQDLQTIVIDELRYDPSVESATVDVSVNDGIVKLSGEVASMPEKLSANRSAMRIRGVRAVNDEITVKNPGNSDADIADTARNMLKWAADVPKDSVKAHVDNHVITLSGTVAWQYQRDAAARTVTNMRGITALTNQIIVDQPESVMPARSAIAAAFQRNALLDPEAIRADIDGHELVLRGNVRSFAEYRQAERTAWAAAGVTNVRNDLVVMS